MSTCLVDTVARADTMAKRRDYSDDAVGGVLRVEGILVEILDGTVDTADVRTIDTPS